MNHFSRRSFFKMSAAVAAAFGTDRLHARTSPVPLGLQLYSVRDQLPNHFDGTLHQVRAAGYTVVEAAGYFGRTALEFRHSMDQAGLRCVSTHHALNILETQLDQWLDYAHTLGLEYVICSSSGGMHRDPNAKGAPTLDDWRWIADEINRIGEKVKSAGMTFGVHNHTPEFAVIDGTLVYDVLLKQTDPKYVIFEMDCGWVYASGHNPVDYLSKDPKRFPLIHVKAIQHEPDGKVHMPVVGKAKPDYGPILRAATGLKYYFVEQEQFDMDPFEELKLDADYMRNLKA